MGNSVYISKNLTKAQLEFLKLLDEYEISIFRFEEIEKKLHAKFDNLNEILENLVNKEFLIRIERGKFIRFNFKEEYVIGTFVIPNSAVAYWSALNLHGLSEQFSNTIFIQSTESKNNKTILGTSYKFIKIAKKKKVGITYNGYGSYRYPLTDREKTLLDCFDLPLYAGGYEELIRALIKANSNAQKMISYAKAIENKSIIKRIGFIADFFKLNSLKKFVAFAKSQLNNKYDLMDPQGNPKGEFISDWKLRLNITKEQLKGIAYKPY